MAYSTHERKIFHAIVERDKDGYFTAEVKELKYCYTEAKTLGTLMERLREVIILCLEEEQAEERMKSVTRGHIATKREMNKIPRFDISPILPSELWDKKPRA